jgi:peroxiredoxin
MVRPTLMRTPLLALICCIAALAAIALFVLNGARNAQFAAEFMAAADDPYLLDLDGKYIDLANWNTGRIVVAIFTRSDCPISNRYAPDIRQLYENFHPLGVEFYLIYVDPQEQPDAIRSHLAEYEYPCPALRDPEHTLVAATGATVTPEAVVFNAKRSITYRGRIDDLYADFGKVRSAPTQHDLADALEATLAGRKIAEPVTKAVGCNIEDLK